MNHSDEDTPTENLQLETDKTSGKVHHREKFGFCAFPAEFGVTGRTTFIVNQNNTILFERHNGQFTDYWPSDEELRHDWAKGD
jgi:hypothetical protein